MEIQPDMESKPEDITAQDKLMDDIDMEGGFALDKAELSARPQETFYNSLKKWSNKVVHTDAGGNTAKYGFDMTNKQA